MKNKNIKIIGLIISIIAVIAIGTFAWLTWSSQQNTDLYSNVGNILEVKFTTGNDINATDMLPTLDPETGGEVTTFSVKNRVNYDYAIDIVLNITSISTELKSNSFKYLILSSDTENGEYTSVASGDFTNMIVGDNTIGGEVIPKKATKYFKFIVYIDGSVENNSNVMGKALSGELNVTAHENEPNPPALVDGLIPVKYDEENSKWVKADSTNTSNDWYDYKNKKWANAVLVRETGYEPNLNQENKTVSIDNTPTIVDKYTSSNQGIANSKSVSTFTFTTGASSGTISFDYTVSSEKNDGLTITLNIGTSKRIIINNMKGTIKTSYSTEIEANTYYVLTVTYAKNGSYDSLDDEATISNIQISNLSGNITVAASGSYGWTRSDRYLYPVNTYSTYDHYDDGTYALPNYYADSVSAEDSINRYICSDTTSTTCQTIYKIKSYSGNTITAVDEYNNNSFTARSAYQNASVGTEIKEDAILAYYVWIPRYKYRVWNINKDMNMTNNLNVRAKGIDILFENNKETTGTIKCNYDFSVLEGDELSETCTGSNGEYYTHPAFTFGNDEVTGFWVGKFEISSENPSANNGGGYRTSLTVRVKPNVRSWRYNVITNFYKVIYDMQKDNNIYGLNTSRSNTDSHVLKNMEWGAIAYLTNSKYGRCSNNTCAEVTVNNSFDFITGNAGSSISPISSFGMTNAYNTSAGQLASTTGNIYGIYDMSGGAYEYVMGNMSVAKGSYIYEYNQGFEYSYINNEKYINTYAIGTSYNNQTAYNRSRLGDATGETKGWYSDRSDFLFNGWKWFLRGGPADSNLVLTYSGLFHFTHGIGASADSSTRASLLPISN